jgi:phospholipase/carboxylesterase
MTPEAFRKGLVGVVAGIGVASLAMASGRDLPEPRPALSGPARVVRIPARVPPRRLLVFLHGYGGSADDFTGLARELAVDAPGDELALLDGPNPVAGGTGRQWWDVHVHSGATRGMALTVAGDGLRAWLDVALRERDLRDEDVVLIGYSQGAALAMSVGSRWRLGGVVAYSGRPIDLPETSVATPFLLVVGEKDPWIRFESVTDFAASLRARGASVALQVHPELGHGIDRRSVFETRTFLRNLTTPTPETR